MDPSTPSTHLPRPQVVVRSEDEVDGGWLYEVEVTQGPAVSHHTVTLAWRDHDYWSGGALAPSRVIQSVIEFALDHALSLPATFDAARIRRLVPTLDSELRAGH